jgi:hypothetical protein
VPEGGMVAAVALGTNMLTLKEIQDTISELQLHYIRITKRKKTYVLLLSMLQVTAEPKEMVKKIG